MTRLRPGWYTNPLGACTTAERPIAAPVRARPRANWLTPSEGVCLGTRFSGISAPVVIIQRRPGRLFHCWWSLANRLLLRHSFHSLNQLLDALRAYFVDWERSRCR